MPLPVHAIGRPQWSSVFAQPGFLTRLGAFERGAKVPNRSVMPLRGARLMPVWLVTGV